MTEDSRPSIAVQSLLSPTNAFTAERWFDAALSAVVGACSAGVIGSWRIVVGDLSDTSSMEPDWLVPFQARARAAGGDFIRIPAEKGLSYWQGHDRLSEIADGDLALIVDPDSIIAAQSLVRMVRSTSEGNRAVTARRLPLDEDRERGGPANRNDEHGIGCLLFVRRTTPNPNSTVPLTANATEHTPVSWNEPESWLLCHGAAIFSLSKYSGSPSASSWPAPEAVGSRPSLLEETLAVAGLDDARHSVAVALTVTGMPLLSIVMRTQTLRPEALRDALLCLAGQSDGRFELLLVVHNVDPREAGLILGDQPEWLKSRTRILTSTGGTRSRPLNDGIAAAQGSLVAFLDDDDLVLTHWVESFLEAEIRNPRRLLRSFAGVQSVSSTEWAEGIEGHRSESRIDTPYPPIFNLADHLRLNRTPFMAFAFPRMFFATFGAADESLDVCEDWDLALRAAGVLGVTDIPEFTAIYRRWTSGRDSYSLHSQSIWERDMARVKLKLDAQPFIAPPGTASDLAVFSDQRGLPAQLAAAYGSSSWRITAPFRTIVTAMRNVWNAVIGRTREIES